MIIRDLGRSPINSTNTAGDDIRYDPLFETLQAEIDAKPSAGSGGVNWKKVVEIATNILETRSKDILVASYLAFALLRTEGVPQGLLNGLVLLNDLMHEFWENMFPPVKRMRGRAQALGWWVERTEALLGEVTDPAPISTETQQELSATVEALYDQISEKCPDAPSLRRILEFVRALPVETEAQPESSETAPQPTAQPATKSEQQSLPKQSEQQSQPQALSAASFSLHTLTNQNDANSLLASVIEKNYLLVDFMLAGPTPEPAWYRLNLLSAWFEISKLPPATDKRTLIPPPDRQITNSLAAMKGADNWGGVVKSGCYTIRRYPFWLDMNRLVAEALGMMGEVFRDGKQVVEEETARFTRHFGEIENYTFSDGTPFADSQTKSWLRTLDSSGGAASQVEIPASGDDLALKVAAEFSCCRALMNSGKQGEGLSQMQTLLQASRSGRERYLWRLSMVQLLTLSGMEKLAIPHICELMKDYDAYRLEEWDPDMALHALKTVWSVLRTQNDPESKRKADETLSRISMLSPSDAFNLIQ
ncbi:type VI secretion system protein TssA [uncultured Desulfobulbus sp.]|uniref:type VI secretion system protein TssA n=1 Tax=uncultured Desulfobulbus sp. TaxID=239745 RepID=UPI0029C96EE1|nr:type VI secretion system protein TssA [uncultured Desulfobulbus sp.]